MDHDDTGEFLPLMVGTTSNSDLHSAAEALLWVLLGILILCSPALIIACWRWAL